MVSKKDLIASVAEIAELSKKDAEAAVNAVLETVKATLKTGEPVTLTGFGKFEVRERSARTGRNPQTGEPMEFAATKVPAFKAGKELKEAVK
ncbi:transcriptional regulator HU subunit beta [Erysipelotrichaceae bacterium]|nr:transcriptional regulator HU subunit beta [Erysipelotrichaceae bacterium]